MILFKRRPEISHNIEKKTTKNDLRIIKVQVHKGQVQKPEIIIIIINGS